MKRFQWVILVSAVGLLGCGPQTREEKVALLTGSPVTGAGVYTANCASCHGADGKGTASAPGVDLSEHVKDHSQAAFISIIVTGVQGTTMAGFASLSDQQLADVYAFIKTL